MYLFLPCNLLFCLLKGRGKGTNVNHVSGFQTLIDRLAGFSRLWHRVIGPAHQATQDGEPVRQPFAKVDFITQGLRIWLQEKKLTIIYAIVKLETEPSRYNVR